jgi:DNA-binding HxlR family transcriptional regulator
MTSEPADHAGEPPAWFGPPVPELDREEAPAAESLYRLIGSRWVVSVLRELEDEPVRYKALHRRLDGISHKMLTQTLRRLEGAGLVCRHVHPSIPPRVDYMLSKAGRELLQNLLALERWARDNSLDY